MLSTMLPMVLLPVWVIGFAAAGECAHCFHFLQLPFSFHILFCLRSLSWISWHRQRLGKECSKLRKDSSTSLDLSQMPFVKLQTFSKCWQNLEENRLGNWEHTWPLISVEICGSGVLFLCWVSKNKAIWILPGQLCHLFHRALRRDKKTRTKSAILWRRKLTQLEGTQKRHLSSQRKKHCDAPCTILKKALTFRNLRVF